MLEGLVHSVLRHREPLLKVSLWLLLVLGVIFSVSSFDAAGKCYVLPCVTDEMAAMFKVNTGQSFVVLLSGFLFIMQPVYGLWFLRMKCSELVLGAFIGGSIFAAVLALMNAVLWGTEADMVTSVVEYEREGHVVTTDDTLYSTFSALSTVATLIFVVGVLGCGLLCLGTDSFTESGPGSSKFGQYQHDPMERRGLKQKQTYQSITLDEDAELDEPDGIGSI